MKKIKEDAAPAVEVSSGNVFDDLGFENPKEMLLKARLAGAIADAIEERKLTQKEAATLMGISQPKVSAIVRGYLDGFSMERLIRFLAALDMDVEISIRQSA
jgi:predicted XRE-type DNA-binding protein